MYFRPLSSSSRSRHGFTLIELLTVIAIIGILAAIIIPTVSKVRSTAKKAQCIARMRQWGNAVALQANDAKSKVFLGFYKDAFKGDGSGYILDPYLNSGGNRVVEDTSGKTTDNKVATRAFWSCPTGINGGNTLSAAQYAFVVPISSAASRPKIKFLGNEISDYYSLGEASAASKLILMIEVKNGANSLDVRKTAIKTALEESNSVISMQKELGYVRHGGSSNALFLDGHVANLSLTDTDYGNSDSKEKLDRWFKLN